MSYRFARKEERSKRPWILVMLGVVAVGAGAAWAIYFPREDPQLAVVQDLGKQMREAEKLPDDQRRALRDQFRAEMEKLSEEERDRLWRERRAGFQRQMEQRMLEVLSLPPEQQAAVLDRHIDEMEKRRKEWESRSQQRGGERKEGPGGAAKEGGKEGSQAGGRGSGTRERTGANSGRNRRLDRTSPKQRAQMTEYRRLMNERRKQRGLAPMGRGRG